MPKRKKRPQPTADLAPPERWQHGHMVRQVRHADAGKAGGMVAAVERCPLVIDRLAIDGCLGNEIAVNRRRTAAEWLHDLWGRTGLANRLTATYEPRSDRSDDFTDEEAHAQKKYHRAMKAMGHCRMVVKSVVCDNVLPRGADRLNQLKLGLDLLARDQGIT